MGLANLNRAAVMNAGAWLHLKHPDDRVPLYADDAKERPVRIKLLGKDSDVYVKADAAAREANVEAMSRGAKWKAAANDHAFAETLAKITVEWENIPQGWVDGSADENPALLSEAAALKLYENLGVKWVREQADEFLGQRSNFSQA
jgi:hypothetical protein